MYFHENISCSFVLFCIICIFAESVLLKLQTLSYHFKDLQISLKGLTVYRIKVKMSTQVLRN